MDDDLCCILTLRAEETVSIHANHRNAEPVNLHLPLLCFTGHGI